MIVRTSSRCLPCLHLSSQSHPCRESNSLETLLPIWHCPPKLAFLDLSQRVAACTMYPNIYYARDAALCIRPLRVQALPYEFFSAILGSGSDKSYIMGVYCRLVFCIEEVHHSFTHLLCCLLHFGEEIMAILVMKDAQIRIDSGVFGCVPAQCACYAVLGNGGSC